MLNVNRHAAGDTELEALGLTCVDVSIRCWPIAGVYTAIVSPMPIASMLTSETHGDAYGPSPRQRYTMGALIPAHVT